MKTIKSTINPPRFSYAFPQKLEDIAFFDIETTGLSPKASSLYLIGGMHYDGATGRWEIIQWFANDYRSEKEILQAFLAFLEDFQYLYHFNGKTFDIPYILQKCQRHAITLSPHHKKILEEQNEALSIDLLKHVRRLRRALQLEKCSQTALEQWLGCQREDAFSGRDLIPVYSEYMQQRLLAPEKAEALEKVLLLHNHDDVEMMFSVSSILSYENYFIHPERLFPPPDTTTSAGTGTPPQATEPASPSTLPVEIKLSCQQNRLIINLETRVSVPKKVCLSAEYPETAASPENISGDPPHFPPAELRLEEKNCTLTIPLYQGTLKYFYGNTKDYYYLPREDMAIHKSIAEFVEKEYRQKATAATCYTRTEGTFLPRLAPYARKKKGEAPEELPHFFLTHKDRLSFCQLPKDYQQNPQFWHNYLTREFLAFL